MNLTMVLFGIVFLSFGILFALGKLHGHIKAWKNMTEEEKKEINIIPLYVNVGTCISLAGMLFLISGIFKVFREKWFVISMVIYLALCILDVIFISKSKRYKNKRP